MKQDAFVNELNNVKVLHLTEKEVAKYGKPWLCARIGHKYAGYGSSQEMHRSTSKLIQRKADSGEYGDDRHG